MPFLNRRQNSIGQKLACLALACLVALAAQARGQGRTPVVSEYHVKAVFLLNFTRFVEWPSSPTAAEAPIVVGILGEDPFGRALDDVVRGETVRGRGVKVRRLRQIAEAEQCDLVFIASSERNRLGGILERTSGKPILTVSDMPEFAELGGMVGLVTTQGKTKLQINVEAAKAAHLSVSSKLLRPAQIVTTRKTSRSDFDVQVESLLALWTPPSWQVGR